jgi:hypothetical protein
MGSTESLLLLSSIVISSKGRLFIEPSIIWGCLQSLRQRQGSEVQGERPLIEHSDTHSTRIQAKLKMISLLVCAIVHSAPLRNCVVGDANEENPIYLASVPCVGPSSPLSASFTLRLIDESISRGRGSSVVPVELLHK